MVALNLKRECTNESNYPYSLSNGAFVEARGRWIPSPGGQQSFELQASQIEVLGPCNAEASRVFQFPAGYLRADQLLRRNTRSRSTT
jgi:aspartyl/asparaginyl-tRNA synthetase